MKEAKRPGSLDSAGNMILPMDGFYTALKLNNFQVTPQQIIDANRLISQFAGQVRNEQELCHYLSPVFANSLEEQVQFKEIFDEYFSKNEIIIPYEPYYELLGNFLRKHGWKYVLALTLIISGIIYLKHLIPNPVKKPKIFLSYRILNPQARRRPLENREINEIKVLATIEKKDSLSEYTIKGQKINWSDGSDPDTALTHSYKTEGSFSIYAYLELVDKNQNLYTDTLLAQDPLLICFHPVDLKINGLKNDSVKIGDTILLKALLKGEEPDSIIWSNEDQSQLRNGTGAKIITSFDHEGIQTFHCKAYYGSENAPCNADTTYRFTVYNPNPKPRVILQSGPNSYPLKMVYRVKKIWYNTALASGILFLMLSILFLGLWIKFKNRKEKILLQNQEKFNELIRSFCGQGGPVDIPFQNKNYLPLPEPDLSIVARGMRQRISDESLFMNLGKTIEKAIRNGGFFEPVMQSRSQQSEFLVLIDEENPNNQLNKLLEYLLDFLKKQNVYINTFYYRKEPAFCYNSRESDEISLEKLSEKFPNNILLILGDAYQLIYPYYPIIDQKYLKLLNRWEHKAIITPVSFPDWGNKEIKVLLPELPILPLDIGGLLLLMPKLFGEEVHIIYELEIHRNDFYDLEIVDFENLEELYTYCQNAKWANVSDSDEKYSNLLFQWIAALAVYPKINWEITLAIGKSILDQYNLIHELNFTNLLLLTRISWMRKGQFPNFTRLGLLKNLSVKNEILARETILAVLNEIPENELSKDHFAYEEKETQRIINEFNLYAYDPDKYRDFKDSRDLFEQLNSNNLIMDSPIKSYLENPSLKWQTLINKPKPDTHSLNENVNTTLDDYLNSKPSPSQTHSRARFYLWAGIISLILLISVFLGLFYLKTLANKNQSNLFTEINGFSEPVSFFLNDTLSTKGSGDIFLKPDSTEFIKLSKNQKTRINFKADSSPKPIALFQDGIPLFDTSLKSLYNAYTIKFIANPKQKSSFARPNLTIGIWWLSNAIDNIQNDWSQSKLIFSSQKDTTDGLILEGAFSWTNQLGYLGMEHFKGHYYDKNRSIDLKGIYFSNMSKKGNGKLTLGTYSAILSNDASSFSKGIFGSATDMPIAKLISYWTASRQYSNTIPIYTHISLFISSPSLNTSANAFRKELLSKGYKVNPVSLKNFPFNSDIYYYNRDLESNANSIQTLYAKYYPALNIKAHLKSTHSASDTSNEIVIWIKQLQNEMINGLNLNSISYQGNGTSSLDSSIKGGIYFNPQTQSWEEKNNDPKNYGMAKKLTLVSRDSNSIILQSPDPFTLVIDLKNKKVKVASETPYNITGIDDYSPDLRSTSQKLDKSPFKISPAKKRKVYPGLVPPMVDTTKYLKK